MIKKNRIEDVIERRERKITTPEEFYRWLLEINIHSDNPVFEVKEKPLSYMQFETGITVLDNGVMKINGGSLNPEDINHAFSVLAFTLIKILESPISNREDELIMKVIRETDSIHQIELLNNDMERIKPFIHLTNELMQPDHRYSKEKTREYIEIMKNLSEKDLSIKIKDMKLKEMIEERFKTPGETMKLIREHILVKNNDSMEILQDSEEDKPYVYLEGEWHLIDIKEHGIEVQTKENFFLVKDEQGKIAMKKNISNQPDEPKWEALLKIEKITGKDIPGHPLPEYKKKINYTEIEIGEMDEDELKELKKAIHQAGYKWKSGNFIGNNKEGILTMISPLITEKESNGIKSTMDDKGEVYVLPTKLG